MIQVNASDPDQGLGGTVTFNMTVSYHSLSTLTVKFLNFGTPEMFAVLHLKFKQRGQILRYFVKMVQME